MGRALLFLTGGLFIVVGIIQMGIANRQQVLPQRTVELHSENQAKNLTASLIDYAIHELRNNQEWNNSFSSDNFLNGEVNLNIYNFNDFLNSPDEIPDHRVQSWNEFTLLLHATSNYNGKAVATEVQLTKDAFSRFSYFTDMEGDVYFIWLDELSGPVHTNGTFNIAGDPTFHGMVTSPNDWHGYSQMENDPQFLGGADFNAEEKPMPTNDQLNALRHNSQNGGLHFNNPIEINLNADGTATITERLGGPSWNPNTIEHNVTLSNYNGTISSTRDVGIQGTLNGQLTVHSERDIKIIGDVVYNNDPRVDESSTDLLGLVSERQVIIDKDAHTKNGSQNLEIHASIMALDKSFTAENYNSGGLRGELNLLGGMIQQQRGPVGTFNGTSVTNGFSKNYEYDDRLLSMIPPSYPRESFFSIVYWRDEVLSVY